MKKSTINKREKFAREAVEGAAKLCKSPYYLFEEADGKQYITNQKGTMALGFTEAVCKISQFDHFPLARIFKDKRNSNMKPLEVPSLAELKQYRKDIRKLKEKLPIDFGEGMPAVSVDLLITAIENMENVEFFYSGMNEAIYGRTPMEYSNVIKDQKYDECLIMPCWKMSGSHKKTDFAEIHKRAESV